MKNKFVGYTPEEVMAFEAVTYIIQVGSDIFNIKGNFVFNKKSAAIHYNRILRQILYKMQNGTKTEKMSAEHLLNNLKILPLRLH